MFEMAQTRPKTAPRENAYQANLIKRIEERFPGCIIEKSDPNYRQGTPDLTVYFEGKWAKLETKRDTDSSRRANQDNWQQIFDEMSFSRFIYPENEEEVLNELGHFFGIL